MSSRSCSASAVRARCGAARVSATGDPVALKRLPIGDAAQVQAARAEAALLSTLDHPHLIRLHELVPQRRRSGAGARSRRPAVRSPTCSARAGGSRPARSSPRSRRSGRRWRTRTTRASFTATSAPRTSCSPAARPAAAGGSGRGADRRRLRAGAQHAGVRRSRSGRRMRPRCRRATSSCSPRLPLHALTGTPIWRATHRGGHARAGGFGRDR